MIDDIRDSLKRIGGRTHHRVRTPIVLQMEAVECGAASLAIILGHYRRFETLDRLREELGVSRDGSNAANIVRVAERYGCEAHGYRKSSEDVLKGPFPSIVFWSFNHFLVLEGVSGSKVHLNDPAVGHRTITRSEFEAMYSGVVLVIKPGPKFEPAGRASRPLVQLLHLAMDYRREIIFVLVLGLLLTLPSFILPSFVRIFIDDVMLRGQEGWLVPLCFAVVLAIVVQAALSWIKDQTLLRVEIDMTASRSAAFFWHVLRLPSRFFGLRYLGDITSRVSSVQTIAQTVSSDIGSATISFFTALILFTLMAFLDHLLAFLAAAGALMNILVLRLLHNTRLELAVRLNFELGKLFATSVIGLRMMEFLKASGREDDFFEKWAGDHARAVVTEQLLSRVQQLSGLIPTFLATATIAVILWVGGSHVIDTSLTIGGLVAFQLLFSATVAPAQRIMDSMGHVQQVSADLTRINDVLNHPLDWRHTGGSSASIGTPRKASHLRLEGVLFGYNPLAPPLIDGLDLDIAPGGWVALVGMSGSGKSTIAKLVTGLFEPWGGRITIDGRSISALNRNDLSGLIASVDQEIVLYEGNLQENITLWDESIPQQTVFEAARDAELLDMIVSRAPGLNTAVAENGRNFSGGERQRIEIARALVRAPSLLVLDEATSALDPLTEHKIMRALRARGLSCLVVAHRLSTIRDCDEIIVLDRGQVVERGTHNELVNTGGAYDRLIEEGRN